MNEIDVAIAIVSYRSAALTIDCLRSIEVERSTPGISIRVIVVDNASGDAPAIAEAIEKNSWSSWVTLVKRREMAALRTATISHFGLRRIMALPITFTCLTLTHLSAKERSGRWFVSLRHTQM